MTNKLMFDITSLEAKIFDKEHEVNYFISLVNKYLELLNEAEWNDIRHKFNEVCKTLLPLRTFLHHTTYKKVEVSSKNSPHDTKLIDAIVSCEDDKKTIQISYATDGEQIFYQLKVLKMSKQYFVSCDGKIFPDQMKMERDLFDRYPHLKDSNKFDTDDFFRSRFGMGEREYYINENYRKIQMNDGKIWYQAPSMAHDVKDRI